MVSVVVAPTAEAASRDCVVVVAELVRLARLLINSANPLDQTLARGDEVERTTPLTRWKSRASIFGSDRGSIDRSFSARVILHQRR